MSLRSSMLIPALACFLIGCNDGSSGLIEPLVPVGGTLLVDGEPLDGVLVTFIPEISVKGRRGGSGKTDESGAFTITNDGQNKPGLAVGKYTVAYSRMRLADGSAAPELAKGQQPDAENIQVETFPAHLTTPDPKNADRQVDIPDGGNTDLELKTSTKATGP